MGDTRFPLPAIHPDDGREGRVDVRFDFTGGDAVGLVIGQDLVLGVRAVPDGDGDVLRWEVTVCDGSANHLHTLAVTSRYPSDAVLAAAIETARLTYSTYVVLPDEDEPQLNPALARGAQRARREAFRG